MGSPGARPRCLLPPQPQMTAGPSRASGPAEMLTLRRVTPSHRSSTRTLGEPHANAESANPESQLRPPDPEQRQAASHPPGAPAPCVSSQTLGTCGRTPLLTAQDRARPGRGEPPLRSWQSKVCADPKKPPRPRETRRESPRPAPPPATGLVTSEARSANGRGALERSARCAA